MAGPSSMDEGEEVLLTVDQVDMAYGPSGAEGTGTLQITSKRVTWKDAVNADKCLEVEVPCITLHAISKDLSSFPKPCLYCQVTEDEDNEDDSKEVYFVPKEPESLSAIFDAMSRAALLNPDPPEPGYEGGDDELIFDQSGLEGLSDEQARMLEHLDSVLSVGGGGPAAQSGQFEDADAGGDDAHTNGTTVNGGDHMEEAEDEQN